MNLEVLVDDVRDNSSRAGKHRLSSSRVCLHVHSLPRMVELVVTERHVVDTVVLVAGRNTTDRHSNTEPDIAVSNYDVLSAFCNHVVLVARLDRDGVVLVRDVESFDKNVAAMGVNTVRVKGVHGQGDTVDLVDETVRAQ